MCIGSLLASEDAGRSASHVPRVFGPGGARSAASSTKPLVNASPPDPRRRSRAPCEPEDLVPVPLQQGRPQAGHAEKPGGIPRPCRGDGEQRAVVEDPEGGNALLSRLVEPPSLERGDELGIGRRGRRRGRLLPPGPRLAGP